MRRVILFVLGFAAALVLMPTTAVADSATHTYTLLMEGANFGVAPNGDQIAITGEADFSVNPNSVEGAGSFTHTDSSGTVLAAGTWKATGLLDYQSYGCGIVHFPGDGTDDHLHHRAQPAEQRRWAARRGRNAQRSRHHQLQPQRGRRQLHHPDELAARSR